MKYLFIGPRYNADGKSVGGIVVLFEDWLRFCDQNGIEYEVIDTNKKNYGSIFRAYRSIVKQIADKTGNCDVAMMHGTFKDYLYLGPVLRRYCKKHGRAYSLRKFAGNFADVYDKCGSFKRRLIDKVISDAKPIFWETEALCQWSVKKYGRGEWFPNVRHGSDSKKECFEYKRRFVFISRVTKDKGIGLITETFDRLGEEYSIEIYGPLDGYSANDIGSRYKGELSPDEVTVRLLENEVLLLPTQWKGEGYPGIILEALSVGLPVIATRWGGIPEIIKDGYNGILMDDFSAESLKNSIGRLESLDYKSLSVNARESFQAFDSNKVSRAVLNKLMQKE